MEHPPNKHLNGGEESATKDGAVTTLRQSEKAQTEME
jgi:hypothetical protein